MHTKILHTPDSIISAAAERVAEARYLAVEADPTDLEAIRAFITARLAAGLEPLIHVALPRCRDGDGSLYWVWQYDVDLREFVTPDGVTDFLRELEEE